MKNVNEIDEDTFRIQEKKEWKINEYLSAINRKNDYNA